MAVVKADGYGHGLLPAARAAQARWRHLARYRPAARGGRAARRGGRGPDPHLAARPGQRLRAPPSTRDIDVGGVRPWALDDIVAAARATGRTARVHLKVDTGLGRNGAYGQDFLDLVAAARLHEAEGAVRVVGVWSHFAYADEPEHPTVRRAARGLRGGGPGRRGGRLHARGPAPGELRRHPHQRVRPLRPGAPRHRRLRTVPRPAARRPRGLRADPGHDRRRAAVPGEARPGRPGGVVRPRLHHRPRETVLGLVPARVRRRHPPQRHERRPGARSPGVAERHRRPGLHGPVRRRPRPRLDGAGGRRGGAVRRRRRRRAVRAGVGRRDRHHQLRDRDADRATGAQGATSEGTREPARAGTASSAWASASVWPAPRGRGLRRRPHAPAPPGRPRDRRESGGVAQPRAASSKRPTGSPCTSRSTSRSPGTGSTSSVCRRADRRHVARLLPDVGVLGLPAALPALGGVPRRRLGPARSRPVGTRRAVVLHHRPARRGPAPPSSKPPHRRGRWRWSATRWAA